MSSLMRRAFMGGSPPATYATWNPADKAASLALSGGNLTATSNGAAVASVRSTLSKASGKWYVEYTVGVAAPGGFGVCTTATPLSGFVGNTNPGASYTSNGAIYLNASYVAAVTAIGAGNVIGVALDMDGLTCKFYLNNALQYTVTISAGTYFFAFSDWAGLGAPYLASATANFGASAFVYSPPAGYNAGLYV